MNRYPEFKVFIIDDDESVCRGLSLLIFSEGYQTASFESAEDFISAVNHIGPGCILLDVFMNGKSGLELQETLTEKFPFMPIIYITGHGNIPMSVQALKKGAINFLQKPVDEKHLFSALNEAVNISTEKIRFRDEKNSIILLINSLTRRELEVFLFVIRGYLNKQIASELNIAEHTVKLHRGKITLKLGVKSISELIYLAEKAGIR